MSQHFIDNIDDVVLAMYFAGELSEDQEKMVLEWANMDAGNRELFKKTENFWTQTANISFSSEAMNPDVDAAWSKLKIRMDHKPQLNLVKSSLHEKKEAKTGFENRRTWLKIAASVVLLLGIYSVFRWISGPEQPVTFLASDNMEVVTLPDRSVVTLNKGSVLELNDNFKEKYRRVKLKGEAFFSVEKDPSKPFIISAGATEVEVLGTSFFVRALQEEETIEVHVETGKVRLRKGSNNSLAVDLSAGEKGSFNKRNNQMAKSKENNPAVSYWKDKTLVFKKTELKKVISVLKEVFGKEIVLSNEALNQCRLSATFKDKTVNEIVEIIAVTFNLTVKQEDSVIALNGKGCE